MMATHHLKPELDPEAPHTVDLKSDFAALTVGLSLSFAELIVL